MPTTSPSSPTSWPDADPAGSDAATFVDLIGKAAGGATKPLQDLNIAVDEGAVVQQALHDTGKDNPKMLTDSEKAAARFKIIMEKLNPVLGDATTGRADLQDKQAELRAKFENLQTKVGEALQGPLADLFDLLTDMCRPIGPAIDGFKNLAAGHPGLLPGHRRTARRDRPGPPRHPQQHSRVVTAMSGVGTSATRGSINVGTIGRTSSFTNAPKGSQIVNSLSLFDRAQRDQPPEHAGPAVTVSLVQSVVNTSNNTTAEHPADPAQPADHRKPAGHHRQRPLGFRGSDLHQILDAGWTEVEDGILYVGNGGSCRIWYKFAAGGESASHTVRTRADYKRAVLAEFDTSGEPALYAIRSATVDTTYGPPFPVGLTMDDTGVVVSIHIHGDPDNGRPGRRNWAGQTLTSGNGGNDPKQITSYRVVSSGALTHTPTGPGTSGYAAVMAGFVFGTAPGGGGTEGPPYVAPSARRRHRGDLRGRAGGPALGHRPLGRGRVDPGPAGAT